MLPSTTHAKSITTTFFLFYQKVNKVVLLQATYPNRISYDYTCQPVTFFVTPYRLIQH